MHEIEAGWANPGDRTRKYAVDMKCGHVEMRMMRPSTARMVATPDGLIHSDDLCASCAATRDSIAIPALVKRMGEDEVGVTGECRADDYDHGAIEAPRGWDSVEGGARLEDETVDWPLYREG